jgi:hypothetical protein
MKSVRECLRTNFTLAEKRKFTLRVLAKQILEEPSIYGAENWLRAEKLAKKVLRYCR